MSAMEPAYAYPHNSTEPSVVQRVIARTFYRSITADGVLWCESTNSDDVIEKTRGVEGATYSRLDIFESAEVRPWNPIGAAVDEV